MIINPVLHRVLVKPEKVEDADELIKRAKLAGIAVELDKRESKAVVVGTVVKVGSTAFKEFNTTAEEQGVIPGAKIQYAKYSGAEIQNGELILLNDEDIVGVVEEA